ncbi:MAG: methyltransferase [Alphaproteobacteria bacterium]|nr:methyltransferase [Alphaproteobacteria bacterium]
MQTEVADTAEDISKIAFGFMASKTLFAALHVDLFSYLSGGGKNAQALADASGVPVNRITTIATALRSLGLFTLEDGKLCNSPAAEAFLVKGAKYDFGDYLRYQINGQMYPVMGQLNASMDGTLNPDDIASYANWMSDPVQARIYSKAQHAGSLGPGKTIARLVDLSDAKSLLDVGGGTGAMTISLCKANPDLNATIIDFPNVSEIGWEYISDAGLVDRVRYIPANALECQWPTGRCAVLMSYLFSGVPESSLAGLLSDAFNTLRPGGTLMVHDFMVNEDAEPPLAALWHVQHMAFTPEASSMTAARIMTDMEAAGFENPIEAEVIAGMTRIVYARKPE